MSYESPIKVITEKITFQMEDNIVKAVQKYDISVNKTELHKALMYDRRQYTQGFEDGKKYAEAESIRHGHWIRNDNGTYSCSECHSWIPNEQHHYARYCIFCGARMDGEAEA